MYYYSPFRSVYDGKKSADKETCVFCNTPNMSSHTVLTSAGESIENAHYRWIINAFPKFEGHTMVVPKRHLLALDEETPEEVLARHELIVFASKTLRVLYPGSGIEVFIQTGEGSEGTIPHLHWHVVPSLPEDHLRGFDKLGQFFTVEPDKEKIIVFPVPIRLAQEGLLDAFRTVL